MKLFHLTHIKNLDSIFKYGLMPSYIKNLSHWEHFNSLGLKNRSCVYLWDSEHYNNAKYIKDMIYCKMFIHPRNDMFDMNDQKILCDDLEYYDPKSYIDFKKMGRKLYGEDTKYAILEIDSLQDNFKSFGEFKHLQSSGDNIHSTTNIMDDKYAHDDKTLYISEKTVNASNIKIVEVVNTRIYKEKEIGFSFKKSKYEKNRTFMG